MTESHDTRGALTLVAIDIAKGCHEVLVLPPAPARRRRFHMAESVEDYEHLADICAGQAHQRWSASKRPATIIGP